MDWYLTAYIWGLTTYAIIGLIVLFYGWVENSDRVKRTACRWLVGALVWPLALALWIIRKAELRDWLRGVQG